MRVVLLSKALVVGAYQRKAEEIARHEDIELIVLVPPAWRDERGVLPLERAHTRGYTLLIEPIALNGHFHLHFYPYLGRRLRALRPDLLHIEEEPYNLATWHAVRIARRLGIRTIFFSWQNLFRRYPRRLAGGNGRSCDPLMRRLRGARQRPGSGGPKDTPGLSR